MPERERWWNETVVEYVGWGLERAGWSECTVWSAREALRATFGHILRFEQGVKTDTIRQLFGHRDEMTTCIYIGEDANDMRGAVETFDRPRPAPSQTVTAGT